MGALKLLLVLLVVYNNFNHAHSKSVDLTDSENARALLEVFSTILSSPETKNIGTRSIEAEKIIFTDQEIAEVVGILKEKYPEIDFDQFLIKILLYVIKFVFDGLRNVPREEDQNRLSINVILQIMKEAPELSSAVKEELGNGNSYLGFVTLPPLSRSFQREFIRNNAVTLRESAHVPAMRVAGDEEVEE